jgi:hypothetical protein
VLAAGATVLASPELPSSTSVAEACDSWVTGGGPAALLGLALVALLATVLGLAIRSAWLQATASRSYLDSLPGGDEQILSGLACRLIDLKEPLAFCAGYLRPAIYVSQGALDGLSEVELSAVLAHERHHLRRRDPLRRLIARAVADSLFFLPILRQISDRYGALGEVAADEAAVLTVGERRSLASALLKFSEQHPVPAPVAGIDPERVGHLMGDPRSTSWRLPHSALGRSALALGALAALVLLTWHGMLNPTLELPFLLAAACTTLMIGGPAVLAALALRASVRGLRARRA